MSHHLLLDLRYAGIGLRGFDGAITDEGRALAVTKVSAGRDIDNSSERSWLPISDDYLRPHRLTGFSVMVDSEWGDARTDAGAGAISDRDRRGRGGFPGKKRPPKAAAAEGAGKAAVQPQ